MNYIKVTFRIANAEEYTADLLASFLGEIGFESFEETTQGIIGYCPESLFDAAQIQPVLDELPGEAQITYRTDLIEDQNWNQVWEDNYFEPIVVGGHCCIHSAQRLPDKKYKYDIIINPRQAFGTGSHETTRMIVSLLMDMSLHGKTVIDMGCGTGVLAIMASLCGAKELFAVDIDPWSQQNAIDNIAANNIHNIQVALGDANLLADKKCDLLMANINRNILIQDMDKYYNAIEAGGKLMMSGFYSEDLPLIKAKAISLGMEQKEVMTNNDWVAVCYKKL